MRLLFAMLRDFRCTFHLHGVWRVYGHVVITRHTRVHGGLYISALGELPGAALSLSDVTNAAFNATSR